MPATFFPPSDSSEAMSNWLTKPEGWMDYCRTSDSRLWQAVASIDGIITRIAVPIMALIAAPLDSFYNGVWFSVKLLVVSVREVVHTLSQGKHGHFAADVTWHDVGIHLYKCTFFFGAVFGAPVVALASPDQLIDQYRARDLIDP